MLYFIKSYLLLGTISVQPRGLELWKDWGNVWVLQRSRTLLHRYEDPGQLLHCTFMSSEGEFRWLSSGWGSSLIPFSVWLLDVEGQGSRAAAENLWVQETWRISDPNLMWLNVCIEVGRCLSQGPFYCTWGLAAGCIFGHVPEQPDLHWPCFRAGIGA